LIKIYVARHGETSWNAENRIQGRSDPGLSTRGRAHSLELLERFKHQPISNIYTSTLKRSFETAQPIADFLNLPVQKQPELDEMSFGIWEGKIFTDIDQLGRKEWEEFRANRFTYRKHGGENYTDVVTRLKPFVERILRIHAGKEILIVGHRAANRMLIAMLVEYPLQEALKIGQGHDCVYVIERNGKVKVFHHFNGDMREGLLLEGGRVSL
jgi:broad specificity phosphatase PhoE